MVPEGMKESKAAQALAGAQQPQQLPLKRLEVGDLFIKITVGLIHKSKIKIKCIIPLAGWGSGPKPSGSGMGGSGWGDSPTTGWDSKSSGNGEGHSGSWDDGSNYKGSNNSNTWSNNKPDR